MSSVNNEQHQKDDTCKKYGRNTSSTIPVMSELNSIKRRIIILPGFVHKVSIFIVM